MAEGPQPKSKISGAGLLVLLFVAVCCLIALGLTLAGLVFRERQSAAAGITPETNEPTFHSQQLTPLGTQPPTPTATPDLTQSGTVNGLTPTPDLPVSDIGLDESLQTLLHEIVPINDPVDLGRRLAGRTDIAVTYPDPETPYAVGAAKSFWVSNLDNDRHFQVTAVLRYLGNNVYFWVQEGVGYNPEDLSALGDTFDRQIYPTTRNFFGSEWRPGIDSDPRIYILYASGLGQSAAGYFSSSDELHPDAYDYSNAHEMFMINADLISLGDPYVYSTLAHEYQHMIHWNIDRNEETWLNEGFSMLSELVNGYVSGGFDRVYLMQPDLQLTDWGEDIGTNDPYYGAAFLFTTYFLDRFGEEATQAVVSHEKNGMESLDLVLDELAVTDPLTGDPITAQDVFADWAVANLLGDGSVADGRYAYDLYPSAPTVSPNRVISTCPSGDLSGSVHQFGVDYIKITCPGDYTLDFSGDKGVNIIPVSPASGNYFFWSNLGDESNMSLERSFDLTGVTGTVKMTYQTWYDLEDNYDYVFLSTTTDGENWQIIESTSCKTEDPSGNSYGCGLNGQTNGWQQEWVNLSEFAGQEVTVRFDYVTDAAVNGLGMVIDDVRVEAIGYFADFEADEGGWQGEGFVRIQNGLPQNYRVSVVSFGSHISVAPLSLNEENQGTVEFSLGDDVNAIVLVISGTTLYTRQSADYQFEIR